MIKVILYHPGQYGVFSDDTYHVCEDVYARFEMLVGDEEFPFRDEASIAFLKKRNCSFIEGDRYAIRDGADIGRVFPITYINRCEQEGLILISNSQRGIYTHTKHLDRLVINALKKLDIDILLAICVDEDDMYNLLFAIKDFEPVNFDYGNDLFNYCRKFEYDWKRDLPDIARLIDMKYPEGCEIVLTYWYKKVQTVCVEAMEMPDTLSMPEFMLLPVPAEPANVPVESAIRSNAIVTMHIGKARIEAEWDKLLD